MGQAPCNLIVGCEDDFDPWFDHLEGRFPYIQVDFQSKTFCPSVKTSFSPAEKISGVPELQYVFRSYILSVWEAHVLVA